MEDCHCEQAVTFTKPDSLDAQLTLWRLSQINGKVNLQEVNLLQNGCYHCIMHLKIGHGHEERHRKESYVVFIPKKYSNVALALWKNDKWLILTTLVDDFL